MTDCPFNKFNAIGKWLRIAALILVLATAAAPFGAVWGEDGNRPEPIEITADQLVTDSNSHTAQFSGNVTAIQGDTKVTADRLVLHYGSATPGNEEPEQTNIEKFEAFGNVRIEFDNRLAVSDQAVYTTSDRRLILTGPQSKVSSGRDEISGSEIVFDRNSDQVKITGAEKSPVKAVIHSNQRGLN
jgi:lipopolysaccharide export system protein LptA